MTYFFKLNAVSILYAVLILIPIELMLNIYRITRITGWDIGTANIVIAITTITALIFFTLLLILLTAKWMKVRKANYWTVVLWVPYYILFLFLFALLFPITYRGDTPNPASGLLVIGILICFPIYVAGINFIGHSIHAKDKENND
ncbi:MAG: hypothetical protein ACQEUT_11565 [Bacillota bacterium]